jgi:hypothetical protein
MIDKKSMLDSRSRLEKTQARKCLAEFFNRNPNNDSFTKHVLEQSFKDEKLKVDLRECCWANDSNVTWTND